MKLGSAHNQVGLYLGYFFVCILAGLSLGGLITRILQSSLSAL